MKVVAPGFESVYDAQKFSVIYFIVLLGCIERVENVATWVPVTIWILLAENATGCPFRGISFDDEQFLVVQHEKNWCFLEFRFKSSKDFWQSSVQFQVRFFFVRSFEGQARDA